MLTVRIPDGFLPERDYIVRTLFEDFLGLAVAVEVDSAIRDYHIILSDQGKLIIEDHFFGKMSDEIYLDKTNLPATAISKKMKFSPEGELIILFGTDNLVIDATQRTVKCGNDIFAASFFFLTRWEEHVSDKIDKYNRFPDSESILFKNDLHNRPSVNEYVEFIWNMLKFIGYKGERKKKEFEFFPTHDVDHIARYDTSAKFMRALAGDIFLRKNPLYIPVTVKDFMLSNLKIRNDNYDTFDFLMDHSEKKNLKSNFYFIGLKTKENTATYGIDEPVTRKIIANIQRRGHRMGIHGSYNSFDNQEQFRTEIERLREYDPDIAEGRQHYFRFRVPDTWRIWDNCGMKYDSSLGYNLDAGFRCGVCYEYPVFDIIARKRLRVKERPLIFMEVALLGNSISDDILVVKAKQYIETVRKYNGTFVFLWHNNSFNYPNFIKGFDLYSQIIQMI